MTPRGFTLLDRLLVDAQNALGTVFGSARAERPNPAAGRPEIVLDDTDRRHAAGLMRVNHVGEVCAQALYVGQAAVARDDRTRAQLLAAAQEETDHLAWCADRLRELDSRPSLLNPLWYAGSYAIGVARRTCAGTAGTWASWSRPSARSRRTWTSTCRRCPKPTRGAGRSCTTMKADEARHADHAQAQGARRLPPPVPTLMAAASKLMKTIAYRI